MALIATRHGRRSADSGDVRRTVGPGAFIKGGPYSQGVYRMKKGEGVFGLLTVEDKGDLIEVSYSGRNNQNEEKISLKFTVPAAKTVAKK